MKRVNVFWSWFLSAVFAGGLLMGLFGIWDQINEVPLWAQLFFPGLALAILWRFCGSDGVRRFWGRIFIHKTRSVIIFLTVFVFLPVSGYSLFVAVKWGLETRSTARDVAIQETRNKWLELCLHADLWKEIAIPDEVDLETSSSRMVTEAQALEALSLADKLETVEEKRRALEIAARYETETEQKGQVPYPSLHSQQLARKQTIINAFTDPENYGLDEKRLSAFNQQYGGKPEEKAGYWNNHYLADKFNISSETIYRQYPLYRNAYAEKEFGEPVATETDFYNRVAEKVTLEVDAHIRGMKAGLTNADISELLAEFDQDHGENATYQGRKDYFRNELSEMAQSGRERIAKHEAIIGEIVGAFHGMSKLPNEERQKITSRLREVPAIDLDFVVAAITERIGPDGNREFEKLKEEIFQHEDH